MDENQIYYLGRVEKITIVLKQNSNLPGIEFLTRTITAESEKKEYDLQINATEYMIISIQAEDRMGWQYTVTHGVSGTEATQNWAICFIGNPTGKSSNLALKVDVTNIQALISKASSGTCILFHLSGANYTGNDLPIDSKYKYGSGIIFCRNPNSCKIVLFPEEMKPVWKMANWTKWKDFANSIVD